MNWLIKAITWQFKPKRLPVGSKEVGYMEIFAKSVRLIDYILLMDLKFELKGSDTSKLEDTRSGFTWAYSEL